MPFGNDVITQRETQSRTLARGFGSEKVEPPMRLENLNLHRVGNTHAVVGYKLPLSGFLSDDELAHCTSKILILYIIIPED